MENTAAPPAAGRRLIPAPVIRVTAAFALLWFVGYRCFRSDHITQIPMLWRGSDPTLFANDWFLSGPAHYATRAIFFRVERLMMTVLSLELTLFVQFLAYLFAYAAALWVLCRKLGRGPAVFAVWILFIGAGKEFGSLAAVDILEDVTVPRMYPYAASVVALPLLLGGHHLLVGFLLGITGLFHAAPSFQFLPIAIAWGFTLHGWRTGLRGGAVMAAAFLAGFWPQYFILKEVISADLYPPAEVIHWLAYVRHPHHMLPSHFPVLDYLQMASLLAAAGGLSFAGRIDGPGQKMLRLVGIMIVYILVSCFFIEVVPNASWIAFQPLRMFAIFRVPLFFLIATHVVDLLRSERRSDAARGVLILVAAINIKGDRAMILAGYLAIETVILVSSRWMRPGPHAAFASLLTLLSPGLWYHGRSRTALAAGIALLGTAAPGLRLPIQGLWRRAWHSRAVAGAVLAADLVFLVLLIFFPFKKWETNPRDWSELDWRHYKFASRFQVHPFPEEALEFAGDWARQNTPPDAVFLIPPARAQESWHIWSRRAAVFNVKMFPYVQSEWEGWMGRYYALGGVLSPSASDEDTELLREDPGAFLIGDLYDMMPANVLVEVARRYGADHIVSPSISLQHWPEVRAVGGPFYDMRERRRRVPRHQGLTIYEVLPASSEPASP